MNNLEELFSNYKKDILYIIAFAKERFGVSDVLLRQKKGMILWAENDVKDSRIKAYGFHGNGCNFRFKSYKIDIEFTKNDQIGFTEWSFFCYAKKFYPEISEAEIKEFLLKMKETREVGTKDNLFVV